MTYHTIRLEIAEGDHYDIPLKPFSAITVREYMERFEGMPEDKSGVEYLCKVTGAPERFIRILKKEEADQLSEIIGQYSVENDARRKAMEQVNETLNGWQEAHGKPFTMADIKAVMEAHAIFRPSITVGGVEYRAPERIDAQTTFGQWLDLEDLLDGEGSETSKYPKALAILMVGPDGGYPTQGKDESDDQFAQRHNKRLAQREAMFMDVPWVDAMGCAAFFFFNSERFEAITSRHFPSFLSLNKRWNQPDRRTIPSDIGAMLP